MPIVTTFGFPEGAQPWSYGLVVCEICWIYIINIHGWLKFRMGKDVSSLRGIDDHRNTSIMTLTGKRPNLLNISLFKQIPNRALCGIAPESQQYVHINENKKERISICLEIKPIIIPPQYSLTGHGCQQQAGEGLNGTNCLIYRMFSWVE